MNKYKLLMVVAEAAVCYAALAVVAVQLNKGLGVGSIFTSDAC